jgi:hypothetical protein
MAERIAGLHFRFDSSRRTPAFILRDHPDDVSRVRIDEQHALVLKLGIGEALEAG